jgi:hypothetical protein
MNEIHKEAHTETAFSIQLLPSSEAASLLPSLEVVLSLLSLSLLLLSERDLLRVEALVGRASAAVMMASCLYQKINRRPLKNMEESTFVKKPCNASRPVVVRYMNRFNFRPIASNGGWGIQRNSAVGKRSVQCCETTYSIFGRLPTAWKDWTAFPAALSLSCCARNSEAEEESKQ